MKLLKTQPPRHLKKQIQNDEICFTLKVRADLYINECRDVVYCYLNPNYYKLRRRDFIFYKEVTLPIKIRITNFKNISSPEEMSINVDDIYVSEILNNLEYKYQKNWIKKIKDTNLMKANFLDKLDGYEDEDILDKVLHLVELDEIPKKIFKMANPKKWKELKETQELELRIETRKRKLEKEKFDDFIENNINKNKVKELFNYSKERYFLYNFFYKINNNDFFLDYENKYKQIIMILSDKIFDNYQDYLYNYFLGKFYGIYTVNNFSINEFYVERLLKHHKQFIKSQDLIKKIEDFIKTKKLIESQSSFWDDLYVAVSKNSSLKNDILNLKPKRRKDIRNKIYNNITEKLKMAKINDDFKNSKEQK